MRSPVIKYRGLKFLTVLAFAIAACIIAVAENGNGDSNEVSTTVTTPDMNSAVSEDSNEVPTTQPINLTTQEPNEGSKQKEVLTTQPISHTAQEPNENPNQKKVSTTLQQRMLKTISVDCINTPIEDVIRMIAEQANVDIIKSPSVTGNVTATLTNVPLVEALDNILAVHGYGCVIDKNMIRIAPIDEIAQKGEILDSRVYRITYADVAQVENALKKFISKRGSISSNPGTSNIIVTDTGSTIKAIDTFIDEIDRITPQVMVEVRIYDVTSTDGFDIGAEWYAGRNNPITTVDTHQDITVNNLTGATTTNTTDTDKDTETAWRLATCGTAMPYRKSKPFVGGSFDADTGGTIHLGLLDTVDIELVLNILRTEVGAKLLANPRILVLDNETAEFKIISEIPYTETSEVSAGGSMTSIKFKEVGVELKVTPHVTRDGMVRLHIIPEFGVVSEKGTTTALGVQTVPTVDTRKVDTKALVKDGQTVVLGGLRKRTVTQTLKKIPILGDVPIMGSLFSDVSEEVKTNELLIFITPKVIIDPTLSPKELRDLKATDFGDPKITNTEDEKAEAEKAEK
jgi:type IV pilus assembly protein PilQ